MSLTGDRFHYVAVDKLFSLARHNRLKDVSRTLDESGFDIDVQDEKGNTLLCVAAQNGLKRMAKLALRMGANLDHQNGIGNTPLHFCCAFGFAELASYFISKGADPMQRNHNGVLCTEGLGKDALLLVNNAISEAQEMGILDETAQQHEWNGPAKLDNHQTQVDAAPDYGEETAYEQTYSEHAETNAYDYGQYQDEGSSRWAEVQDESAEQLQHQQQDWYGQENYAKTSELEKQQNIKPTAPVFPPPKDETEAASDNYDSGSRVPPKTRSKKWRPLPKAPRPRPLPKGPRPNQLQKFSIGAKNTHAKTGTGVAEETVEIIGIDKKSEQVKQNVQRPRSLPKMSLKDRKSLELKALQQIAVEREKKRLEKKEMQKRKEKEAALLSPLKNPNISKANLEPHNIRLPGTTPVLSTIDETTSQDHKGINQKSDISGTVTVAHTSVLQAVHARDLGAVQSMLPPLDGNTEKSASGFSAKQHDIDSAMHAAGLSGQAKALATIMPFASQKSIDRSIIAATARRNHLIVVYILTQRRLAEEAVEKADQTSSDQKPDYVPPQSQQLTDLLEYSGTSKGAHVSQGAIDRALVRASAIELVDQDYEQRKSMKQLSRSGDAAASSSMLDYDSAGNDLASLKRDRDIAFRMLMSVSTVPAIDRAFCSVAASGGGKDKAHMLLPQVSLRGRRSGLLTAAATGNGEILHLTLCAILEADAASSKGTEDSVRAKLRQKARFAIMARAMESAAARGHEECCIQLWELCDEVAQARTIAAANLNGHHSLIELLKGDKIERY